MRKRVVWLLGIVLLSAVAFGAGVWRVKNKGGISQWRLETNAQNPSAYPFITWDDATKGKLGQWLAQKDAQGKLPKFPPQALPVTGFSATSPDLYEAGGFGLIELTSADFVSSKYRGPASRPFRLAAFFRTSIAGEEYLLLVQQWQNPDGSVWFVPLILPVSKAIAAGQATEYYREITAPDSRYFPAPILRLRGREECSRILSSGAYCDWYFGDEARPLKYEQLAQIWSGGRVPSEMVNYPAAFTVKPLYLWQPYE
jgi:hypothetical protein